VHDRGVCDVTGIDPCVLREPCWLEEYLDTAGVADQDWTRRLPDVVIAVVVAMHARGATDEEIARHFAKAREVHDEVLARNQELGGDPMPSVRLGGRWEPTAKAVRQVLDAPGRRKRRQATRPALLAAKRRGELAQPGLFDLEAS
jgi:hypothetical protein